MIINYINVLRCLMGNKNDKKNQNLWYSLFKDFFYFYYYSFEIHLYYSQSLILFRYLINLIGF